MKPKKLSFKKTSKYVFYYQELYKKAEIPAVIWEDTASEKLLPLSRYLVSARRLTVSIDENVKEFAGSVEKVYILKTRFVLLYLNVLKRHPDSKDSKYAAELKQMRVHAEKYLTDLEVMKKGSLKEHFLKKYQVIDKQLDSPKKQFMAKNDIINSFANVMMNMKQKKVIPKQETSTNNQHDVMMGQNVQENLMGDYLQSGMDPTVPNVESMNMNNTQQSSEGKEPSDPDV